MSLKDFQTILIPSKKTGALHFYDKPTKAIMEANFSRPDVGTTSGATVFNQSGDLVELNEDEPDWSFPIGGGCPRILMRRQSVNLLAGSNNPSIPSGNGMNWESSVGLDVNSGIDVFGTSDGFELKPTAANSEHKINIDSNDLFTVGEEHTWLFYIETNGIENIGFNSSVGFPRFNLNLGLETFDTAASGFNSGTIENLGNNKFKVKVKFSPSTIGGAALIYLKTSAGGGYSETFSGDGLSSIKFSHVTICLGNEDLPIPNSDTNSLTRSSNLWSLDLATYLNTNHISFYTEVSLSQSQMSFLRFGDGGNSNLVEFQIDNQKLRARTRINGGSLNNLNPVSGSPTIPLNELVKIAGIITPNEVKMSFGGELCFSALIDLSGLPLIDTLVPSGIFDTLFSHEIKTLALAPVALSDSQLNESTL